MPIIIEIGRGEFISNQGKYEQVPALFLEPVGAFGLEPGKPGEFAPETPKDSVVDGGIVLRFHSTEGARVVIEDIAKATEIDAAQSRQIEALRDILEDLLDSTAQEACDDSCTLENCPWAQARAALAASGAEGEMKP